METHAPKAVFLSYAREDAAGARRIAEALRSSGIEVWFDENELRGGDAWDQKIRRQIKDCSLFLAIISSHTQERGEGYFRLEWNLAVERTRLMMEGVPFLVPVVVDETPESTDMVPEPFQRVQWTRLPKGLPSPQFVEQVQRLLALPHKPVAQNARAEAGSHAPVPAGRSRFPMWPVVAAGVVGSAIVVYLVTRPHTKEPTASPKTTAEVTPARPAPVVSDKSIAVLPFENMSDDKEANAFFADGIHDDVLTTLQNIREIRVVSRTSVMGYRGTTKNIRDVAKELGVAYILEGSVRRAGNSVRVTGQLIDARTDAHLWANQYDRELTAASVFAIQSELAKAIAGELKATLSPQEKKRLEALPTENLAAYELYLKSLDPLKRAAGTTTYVRWREPLLQQAVHLDPKFALAWVGLADVHIRAYGWNVEHTPERLAKAKEALETADRLAPDLPEVLNETGFYYFYLYDFVRAKACFERVIAQLPNCARAWARLGLVAAGEGRWLDALAHLRKAHALDRRDANPLRNLAGYLTLCRRYDEAETARRELSDLLPESSEEAYYLHRSSFYARGSTGEVSAWLASLSESRRQEPEIVNLRIIWATLRGDAEEVIQLGPRRWEYAFAHLTRGERDRAEPLLRSSRDRWLKDVAREPDNVQFWSWLGLVHAALGDQDAAHAAARRLRDLRPESRAEVSGVFTASARAQILAWAGDRTTAISEVARLLRKPGGPNVHELRHSLFWFPLRGDPRFEALLNDPKNNAPLF